VLVNGLTPLIRLVEGKIFSLRKKYIKVRGNLL